MNGAIYTFLEHARVRVLIVTFVQRLQLFVERERMSACRARIHPCGRVQREPRSDV